MYLESFRHPFQESLHKSLHLTQDNIQLILPQDTESLGYDIVADKSPCEVSHATPTILVVTLIFLYSFSDFEKHHRATLSEQETQKAR